MNVLHCMNITQRQIVDPTLKKINTQYCRSSRPRGPLYTYFDREPVLISITRTICKNTNLLI